jgi:hypothetical protein
MGAMWKSRPEACDSDSETASMQVSDIVLLGGSGIGPSLAGNVGAGWAFALPREGDKDVDVPMLAPAWSRCCLLEATGCFDGSDREALTKRGVAVPGAASELL